MRKELILFGIVALVIAGYFLFPTIKDVVTNIPTPTPEDSIDTSDWKTYTNEEYGFSFKYPADLWSNEDLALSTGLTKLPLENNSDTIEFIVHTEPFFDNLNFGDYVDFLQNGIEGKYFSSSIRNTELITINETSVIVMYAGDDTHIVKTVETFFLNEKHNVIVSIRVPETVQNSLVPLNLINSFQFTN
ncbi:hypothetical protein CO179_00850 [candidate division WWE3 bacterium CG_4_9_14_3_um_filter_39_7]|uniref:Uncharacterized protein n=1 Tax=candidate division WWE3 bacterium CG_4_9_14_3_um_filter_39_7 TaxID=1975080 RepID=A0A2M7X4C8_UNCKA|nr:MAG: hypothetical protein CO179_00850 [candidate division WWE3 bacterium CG_4_9_14_3_um_filter_39_7]